jgi:hypothetical protein
MVLSVLSIAQPSPVGGERHPQGRCVPQRRKVFGAPFPGIRWNLLFASCVAPYRTHGGALMMTSKAEEYRAKALECEERAEQTRDPYIKQRLIEIAEKWRHMAAYSEKSPR